MATDSQVHNKRIAQNTLFLYFRMILIMFVSLYTSRVVLAKLGVENYGIYNVVGGVVVMFSFLNSAMAGATQRFLNYDMAKRNEEGLSQTFSTSVIIHAIIALSIFILSETIGLYFLYNKMVIPETRIEAAFWVFQCSVLTMMVNIMSVPYNAVIIAHEKMSAFAYISILEVVLKLLIVYILWIIPFDKLKVYAVLMLGVGVLIRTVYSSYSNRHFPETKIQFIWNKEKIKEMGAFASWNLIGNMAVIGVTQGLNILLNMFFGPTVNAARGVAVQVQTNINQIAQNFQMAINPQIVKSYARQDLDYMHSLICRSSKFSFLLLYLFALPVFIMADQLLEIWLEHPPIYSSQFLRIMLIISLIDALSNPLALSINATGIIRTFQLINGLIMLTCVPISYCLLKWWNVSPIKVFFIQLFMTIVSHFIKLIISHQKTNLPILFFARQVYVRIVLTCLFSFVFPYILYTYICEKTISNFLIIGVLTILQTILLLYYCGLDMAERKIVYQKSISILGRLRNRK